ncbi:MAG TPA: pyridoxamine 5'-phosphate oxidase family protein, partial [Gemmatimonadaceae bacterium]|nr:pyridoxamine 5'-phosphate oxidase family protein [Gemmatimonadaceae bacterium]
DIVPIHYVFHDGWLYGRTSPGPKLTTLSHSQWVAFEVDEVHGLFDWTSVVVKGALLLLDAEGSTAERAAWREGLRLLRELVPTALAEDDPTPHRDVLCRIHVADATGRRARPAD